VLGGDCSILLGNMLALKRRGRYGLLFLDGHADFYQPEAEPTGEAASMDLALATGRGPEIVTNLEGQRPLVHDEDVVVFVFRDAEQAAAEGSQPLAPNLRAMDLGTVRERGVARAAHDALAHLVPYSSIARLAIASAPRFLSRRTCAMVTCGKVVE